MSKQIIEIEVPEGFKATYNLKTMKVEIVKKDNKPRTWKEFCDNYPCKEGEAYISSGGMALPLPDSSIDTVRVPYSNRNLCTSKEEAEAFLALMQLRQLRKAWIGDWKPNYSSPRFSAYSISIRRYNDELEFLILNENITSALAFPTEEMAKEFLECFRDLIETAKILL